MMIVAVVLLGLVPPCCADCEEPDPATGPASAMPACHPATGLSMSYLADCCLIGDATVAAEASAVSVPAQPVLSPGSAVSLSSGQDVESPPKDRAFRRAEARGVPLFTLLCTLLS